MDKPDDFLAALAEIQPILPALLGDDWPAFSQDLDYYLNEIEHVTDDDLRRELVDELRLLFFDYPAADEALRSASIPKSISPAAMPVIRGISAASAPVENVGQTVVRYTDISCPERIWIGAPRITLVVRLAVRPSELSADTQSLELRTDLPVMVLVTASNFDVLNGRQRQMAVHPDRDSEIAIDLKPEYVGSTRISFDFQQGGNPVGSASVQVEVVAEPVTHSADARLEQMLRFEPGAVAPDLVLYIAHEQRDGAPHYVFTLYQAGQSQGDAFPPVPVRTSPLDYTRDLYDTLDDMTISAARADLLIEEIRDIGYSLWFKLIPTRLRRLFLDNRSAWVGKTMLILSDEPYIPWELVWPFDARTGWEDDAPWAQSLNVTRWLRRDAVSSGYDGPASTLTLGSLACVAPTDSDLVSIDDEQAYIQTLIDQFNLRDVTPSPLLKSNVLNLLAKGDYSWLHVATHGQYGETNPGSNATIWLEGSDFLVPDDIIRPKILKNIRQIRPGFVFNACYGSRQTWGFTRLGGWANDLIGAGAGLFLAPMWTVRDDLAYAFSEAFYSTLLRGNTVATALQAGRQAAKRDGNPTWLAYSLYAHPNARVGKT